MIQPLGEQSLGEYLWEQIQGPQGYGFVSDSITEMLDEDVLDVARTALFWSKNVVKILEGFIKYAEAK